MAGEEPWIEILMALNRIGDELQQIRQIWEPAQETDSTGCLHPVEQRIDFGRTNGIEDWECRICQFRTTAPVS